MKPITGPTVRASSPFARAPNADRSPGLAQFGCAKAHQEETVKPLVSILVPAFNEQRWIASTLESAVGQTWPDKEIIVVDDGSTDDTLAIARRFASKGVSVVTQEHQGAAAARNAALSVSQGHHIQWLDANDLLAPDKIERQVLELDRCSRRTLLSSAWGRFMSRYYEAE